MDEALNDLNDLENLRRSKVVETLIRLVGNPNKEKIVSKLTEKQRKIIIKIIKEKLIGTSYTVDLFNLFDIRIGPEILCEIFKKNSVSSIKELLPRVVSTCKKNNLLNLTPGCQYEVVSSICSYSSNIATKKVEFLFDNSLVIYIRTVRLILSREIPVDFSKYLDKLTDTAKYHLVTTSINTPLFKSIIRELDKKFLREVIDSNFELICSQYKNEIQTFILDLMLSEKEEQEKLRDL